MAPRTLRTRNLRVSVQTLLESGVDGWVGQTHTHSFWARIDLIPMNGEQVARFAGAGYDANWKGSARLPPVIPDGARVVAYEGAVGAEGAAPQEGNREIIVLDVKQSLARGRMQELLFKEITDEVDEDATAPVPPDGEEGGPLVPYEPPEW
jgi:hypothetical protein